MTYEPSLGYQWPLEVGKSFNHNYRLVNHATNRKTDIQATMTIESFAEITVPAGTFNLS